MTGQRFDPLLPAADRDELNHRWTAIETGFVEDPERHIGMADELLGDVIDRLQTQMQGERDRLSTAWKGSDVTTEQLRELLLQYRSSYLRLRDAVVAHGEG